MSGEQKKDILSQKVDEEQLEHATGGSSESGSECTKDFKRDVCQATVEQGSWCSSNDACLIWDCTYEDCSTAFFVDM